MHNRTLATKKNRRGKEEFRVENPLILTKTLPKKALKKQSPTFIDNYQRKQMTLERTPLTKCLPLGMMMNLTLTMKCW